LKLGAHVNARNHNGETPIFTIMNDRVIPLFLQHGADLTIRNNQGDTGWKPAREEETGWDEALRKAIADIKQPQ
jgi:hypothetical protein